MAHWNHYNLYSFFLQCSNRYAPVFWCASLAPFPSNEAGVNVEVELLAQVRHVSGQGVQVHHHGIPASRHDNTQDLSWRHLCRQRLQLVVRGLQWALFASFDTLSDCQGGVTSSTWGNFTFLEFPLETIASGAGMWSAWCKDKLATVLHCNKRRKEGNYQKIAELWKTWRSLVSRFQLVPGRVNIFLFSFLVLFMSGQILNLWRMICWMVPKGWKLQCGCSKVGPDLLRVIGRDSLSWGQDRYKRYHRFFFDNYYWVIN